MSQLSFHPGRASRAVASLSLGLLEVSSRTRRKDDEKLAGSRVLKVAAEERSARRATACPSLVRLGPHVSFFRRSEAHVIGRHQPQRREKATPIHVFVERKRHGRGRSKRQRIGGEAFVFERSGEQYRPLPIPLPP